ncbi:hypothetical protein AVEN_38727-1 [Araneus ventricosus]|uniref:Uncharacterized protein n=1 Tax=Araneus ventricosus TaxID=182803 RepID=A0A4Y2IB94_ARAVE|nr:hypothetical protein AVEN_38727-1 [Araneus ventricosus]
MNSVLMFDIPARLIASKLTPAIHLYSIPSICPNTVFFHPLKSKNQQVIHLKLQSALSIGESDLLSPLQLLFNPPISPVRGFPINVASSRGPNLIKSFGLPLPSHQGPT